MLITNDETENRFKDDINNKITLKKYFCNLQDELNELMCKIPKLDPVCKCGICTETRKVIILRSCMDSEEKYQKLIILPEKNKKTNIKKFHMRSKKTKKIYWIFLDHKDILQLSNKKAAYINVNS